MRINKYIAENSELSRRKADEAIKNGRVKINGNLASLGDTISSNDELTIDGNIVKYAVRNKKGENLKEKYDKIIHYCELAKELKCG